MDKKRIIKTIALDCAPGTARPDNYIEGLFEGTGIEYDGREPVSKIFGNWLWEFSDVDDELWLKVRPLFQERITALYNCGAIRYGSW